MRYALVGIFLLAACSGGQEPTTLVEEQQEATPTNTIEEVAEVSLSGSDRQRVCKATIASLNGQPPSIMHASLVDEENVLVSYARPSDGKNWHNECKFEGNQVVWRGIDAFGAGSGPGRWRDGPYDERISYEVNPDRVTINMVYSDGSTSSEHFEI